MRGVSAKLVRPELELSCSLHHCIAQTSCAPLSSSIKPLIDCCYNNQFPPHKHAKAHIMSAPSASRLFSQAARTASRSIIRSRPTNAFHLQPCRIVPAIRAVHCSRSFSASASKATGLMPDTENPSTPKREPLATTLTPAEISDEEFHTLSDEFLEKVHEKAEQVQEGREDVEVDYSVSPSCSQQHRYPAADIVIGRRPEHYFPSQRHIRAQQATTEQADLAVFALVRTQTLRLDNPG